MAVSIKLTVRIPRRVHSELEKMAKRNLNSLNKEIVDRLANSLDDANMTEELANDSNFLSRLETLEKQVAKLVGILEATS